jgi:hypothetical protein
MPNLPHFDAAFRLGPNGKPVVVEQDSPQDVGQCVYDVLVCPEGAKLGDATFGVPSPLGSGLPLDLSSWTQALNRLEPRASYTVDQLLTLAQQGQDAVTVTVRP